jgi:phage terminase large subunit
LDEPAKLHGLKQNIFWLNELIGTAGSAYQPTKETFDNLEQRTTEIFITDYNPKVTKHWVYSSVLTRDDIAHIHSTMLDNPFLEDVIKKKILSYEPTAENIARGTADAVNWKVYGLGQRGQHKGIVFTNINYVKFFPQECARVWYGLDFGFVNDVTALVKVGMNNGELFAQQLIYETGLTNSAISRLMIEAGLHNRSEVIADSAEQKSIQDLKNFGWNIEGAMKGPDSVLFGINAMKTYKINVVENSLDLKNEFDNYSWKEDAMTGEVSNTPVDNYNHAIDAIRYVALNRFAIQPRKTVKKLRMNF